MNKTIVKCCVTLLFEANISFFNFSHMSFEDLRPPFKLSYSLETDIIIIRTTVNKIIKHYGLWINEVLGDLVVMNHMGLPYFLREMQ